MWEMYEHKDLYKKCKRLPPQVQKKYILWKELVARHGPKVLRGFPGFHYEKLKGERLEQRSSRLSMQYRVIYSVSAKEVSVYVLE